MLTRQQIDEAKQDFSDEAVEASRILEIVAAAETLHNSGRPFAERDHEYAAILAVLKTRRPER